MSYNGTDITILTAGEALSTIPTVIIMFTVMMVSIGLILSNIDLIVISISNLFKNEHFQRAITFVKKVLRSLIRLYGAKSPDSGKQRVPNRNKR